MSLQPLEVNTRSKQLEMAPGSPGGEVDLNKVVTLDFSRQTEDGNGGLLHNVFKIEQAQN